MAQSKTLTFMDVADTALRLGIRNFEELRSVARQPGPPGEPGKDGTPGKLDVVKSWSEGIAYEGDVRFHDGSTYQARRDTAREPPHEDWQPLATRGQDGRGFVVRGTWSPTETYARHDIVARNASSFVALKDNPGECPGEDWQLWAGQGKTGKPGEPGRQGIQGQPGKDGAAIVGGVFDARDMKLILTRSDGGSFSVDMTDFALAIRDI
jgi:hypothetical protein